LQRIFVFECYFLLLVIRCNEIITNEMKTFVLVCYEFVTLVTSVILAHIIDNTHRRTYVGTCIRAALSLRTIAGLTKDECRYTLSKDFWMYYVYFSLHLAFLFHGLILTYSYAAQTSIFMLDCSYYHLFFFAGFYLELRFGWKNPGNNKT